MLLVNKINNNINYFEVYNRFVNNRTELEFIKMIFKITSFSYHIKKESLLILDTIIEKKKNDFVRMIRSSKQKNSESILFRFSFFDLQQSSKLQNKLNFVNRL